MAETVGLLILAGIGASAEVGAAVLLPGLTVATAVGSTALVGGSLIAASQLNKSSGSGGSAAAVAFATPKPMDGRQTIRQTLPPRIMGYGRARISGAYMLYDVDTVDYDSHDVIALHEGRIQSIYAIYLNDDEVDVNTSTGWVYNIRNNNGNDGRYGCTGAYASTSKVLLQWHLGSDPGTYYPPATTAFPYWGTNTRGDGIATIYMRCSHPTTSDNFYTLFPNGLPRLSVAADLAPIYDPRDVSQSRANPSTWRTSRNPVLQILNYLTDARGMGLDWDDLITPQLSSLMAQADICDELVTKIGGTGSEKRYQSSGWFFLTTDPAEVLSAILATCDGWLAENGDGSISIVVGKYQAPTVTFTDDHIIGYTIDHGVADYEVVNQIKFTYTPEANYFRETPGNPWTDTASVSALGKIRAQQMDLTWVESHAQARRLAKRQMAKYQAPLRGTLSVSLYGLLALGQRWVGIQSSFVSDLTDAVVEITKARVDITNARVVFDWILVDPATVDAWNASTEQGADPSIP